MRHDVRLLYLCQDTRCPFPVSVRLPTGSCRRGCFFCCKASTFGNTRFGMQQVLTRIDFLRLWQQIIFEDNFRFVWPQKRILTALKNKRVLRFVREDLFESSLSLITKKVLQGLYRGKYGLLVKTSSVDVINYISDLKKIKHCIVFSITDLLDDYREKVKVVNECVRAGLNFTLSLSPVFEFNDRIKYILSSVDKNILGVELGWLHGVPSLINPDFLRRDNYKYVRWERQYKRQHLEKTVRDMLLILNKRSIELRHYFSSLFYKDGACCLADSPRTGLYNSQGIDRAITAWACSRRLDA